MCDLGKSTRSPCCKEEAPRGRWSVPGCRWDKRPVLSWCLPSQALPYVALLIAMLFFIYAVIGMQVSPSHPSPGRLCRVAPNLWQDVPWSCGMERAARGFSASRCGC